MSIVVFWLESRINDDCMLPHMTVESLYKKFDDSQLSEALTFAEVRRKQGHNHVVISSEMDNQVGKSGVSSVEDGKTPDGFDYEWSKQHRGGPPLSKE